MLDAVSNQIHILGQGITTHKMNYDHGWLIYSRAIRRSNWNFLWNLFGFISIQIIDKHSAIKKSKVRYHLK